MKTPFTLLAALAFVLIVAAAVVTGSLIAASPALAATAPGAPLDPQTLSWGLAAAAASTALCRRSRPATPWPRSAPPPWAPSPRSRS